MSTTKTTTKAKDTAAVEAAASRIAEAEAKHAAVLAEVATAEENVSKAEAELKRIEQCIASDDPSAGLNDLTKADTELRFFKLQARAKATAAVRAGGAVRTAETVRIMARLETGEYGIDMGGLRAEGEALASKIAGLLIEYREQCKAHEAGRLKLWNDMKASDAANDEGTGNPASPLAYGHEDRKRFKPFWLEVNSEPVPVIGDYRLTAIQKRVEWIVNHGEELAAEHASI
jgi:hypothetical protein